MKNYELLAAKISIFVIYFWFGILKLLGVSPATPLVATLFEKTISFMPFSVFYSFFAIFVGGKVNFFGRLGRENCGKKEADKK